MSGSFPPLARAAEFLGGEVRGDEVVCPGPGHTDADRSLSVKPSKDDPEGFTVHSFCGDDWRECRALARKKLGSPEPKHAKQKNGGGKAWTFIAEYTYPDAKGAPYSCVKKIHRRRRQEAVPTISLGRHQVGEGQAQGLEGALQVA